MEARAAVERGRDGPWPLLLQQAICGSGEDGEVLTNT